MDPETSAPSTTSPSLFRTTLAFLLVSMAWGLTVPFMRRAAAAHTAPAHLTSPPAERWRLTTLVLRVWDVLRRPAYAVPFALNITGSVWFFLLVGKQELSLTVPVTNAGAFLFTVLGEWAAEGRRVEGATWAGMGCVVLGIALCVRAKG